MIEEQFAYGTSAIHTLDPRAKVMAATIFSIVIAISRHVETLVVALPVACVLLILARLPLGAVIKRLAAINVFVMFLWLFIPFSVPGEPLFTLLGLSGSREGVNMALLITLKSNAIIIAFTALIATTPVPDLGHALRKLRVPDKLGWLLIFTYRHIFLIAQEYDRLHSAMKIRGFIPRTNLHTYRAYASLVGMVLVRSWERSERVYHAMLCRGFNGSFKSLNGFTFTHRDTAFLALMFIAVTIFAAGEILLP